MTTCFSRYLMIAALLALFSTASATPVDPADGTVEIAEFTLSAGDRAMTLTWRTASETDNAGFEIYRSNGDTMSFRAIANYLTDPALTGLGTSTAGKIYSFLDNDPSLQGNGTYCYRIVTISVFGIRTTQLTQCAVLGTASVTTPKSSSTPLITPNPTTVELRVSYVLPIAASVSLQVFATDGSLVLSPMTSRLREAGNHTEVIGVGALPTGTYTLRLVAGDTLFDERFVVR